jgi:hypothetical protein
LTTSRKSFGQKAGDAVSGNQNENSGSIVDSVKVSTIIRCIYQSLTIQGALGMETNNPTK